MAPIPKISVVMPVYNGARYVALAIESVLSQTYGDFEFLIFDDESTDATRDILAGFSRQDARVKVIAGKHRGYSHWLNEGIAISRAPLIARMDADDISLPDRFADQVEFLMADADLAAVGAEAVIIDPDGDEIDEWRLPLTHEEIDGQHLNGTGGAIIHPSAMIRKNKLTEIGGYRTDLEPSEDFDLWLRLAEVGRLANVGSILLQYRVHGSNVTMTRCRVQRERTVLALAEAFARRRISVNTERLDELRARVPTPPLDDELVEEWVWRARRARNFRTACKHASRIVRSHPMSVSSWRLLAGTLLHRS